MGAGDQFLGSYAFRMKQFIQDTHYTLSTTIDVELFAYEDFVRTAIWSTIMFFQFKLIHLFYYILW